VTQIIASVCRCPEGLASGGSPWFWHADKFVVDAAGSQNGMSLLSKSYVFHGRMGGMMGIVKPRNYRVKVMRSNFEHFALPEAVLLGGAAAVHGGEISGGVAESSGGRNMILNPQESGPSAAALPAPSLSRV